MSESEKNLREAFAGESQANRKYLAFAKKAEAEGSKGVAKLFGQPLPRRPFTRDNHLEVLQGVKSTLENLKEAYGGEHFEFTKMYPVFIEKRKRKRTGLLQRLSSGPMRWKKSTARSMMKQ